MLLIGIAWIAGMAGCQPVSPPDLSIAVTPDPAETTIYGLFETIEVACSAILPDGTPDDNCDHYPHPPRWTVSHGEIQAVAGCVLYWNTGHVSAETDASITVEYGGATKRLDVTLHSLEGEVPPAFWTYPDLSPMDEEEMTAYGHLYLLPHNEEKMNAFIEAQRQKAQQFSDELRNVILEWYYSDDATRVIPKDILSSRPEIDNTLQINGVSIPDDPSEIGIAVDTVKTHTWTLIRYDDINPEDQWYYYSAREGEADPYDLLTPQFHKNNANRHGTYLKNIYIAPIGATLVVEGDFPHSRYMGYHISPPYDPEFIHFANQGKMEVPLVDVDINSKPGSVNPFRPGQDRNAADRAYRVVFHLEQGDMVSLNPEVFALHANGNHYFRDYGRLDNARIGGPFGATGPQGRGKIVPAVLWLRIYLPDQGHDPYELAGVGLPRAHLEMEHQGEVIRFWIQPDVSYAAQRETKLIPSVATQLNHNVPLPIGSQFGWLKMFGIWQVWAEARAYSSTLGGSPDEIDHAKRQIRYRMEVFESRGQHLEPPGSIGQSATDCPYNSYLTRGLWIEDGMVYVIAGRKPTTPRTFNGEATLEPAEARYWSISNWGKGPDGTYNGVVYGTLSDEDVVTDGNNNYLIVYSRKDDRPANALLEYGVTWQDFGPDAQQALVIRWMEVYPEHHMEDYVPSGRNIPWETGAWSQAHYDQSLVGRNDRSGVVGEYHPRIYYMSKAQFESLGSSIDEESLPVWEYGRPELIPGSIEVHVSDVLPSATIYWKLTRAANSRIEYSTDPDAVGSDMVREDANHWRAEPSITLDGLNPSTTYYYRLVSDNGIGVPYMSAVREFTTRP